MVLRVASHPMISRCNSHVGERMTISSPLKSCLCESRTRAKTVTRHSLLGACRLLSPSLEETDPMTSTHKRNLVAAALALLWFPRLLNAGAHPIVVAATIRSSFVSSLSQQTLTCRASGSIWILSPLPRNNENLGDKIQACGWGCSG